MPGMLETILGVGMNKTSLHGQIRVTGNPRLAFDSYRRFIQSFAEVVGGAAAAPFEAALAQMIHAEDVADEAELDPEALERLGGQFLDIATRLSAAPPDDPIEQLMRASRAVYKSWESPRAREYRRLNALDSLHGTAVTVQAMVFGNSGGDSGAGVAFSRDPATGAKGLYVDFLIDAQGEDVVSGRRTPSDASSAGAAHAQCRARAGGRRPELWRKPSATSRTSNSRWSAAVCSFCRRAPPSARRARR